MTIRVASAPTRDVVEHARHGAPERSVGHPEQRQRAPRQQADHRVDERGEHEIAGHLHSISASASTTCARSVRPGSTSASFCRNSVPAANRKYVRKMTVSAAPRKLAGCQRAGSSVPAWRAPPSGDRHRCSLVSSPPRPCLPSPDARERTEHAPELSLDLDHGLRRALDPFRGRIRQEVHRRTHDHRTEHSTPAPMARGCGASSASDRRAEQEGEKH